MKKIILWHFVVTLIFSIVIYYAIHYFTGIFDIYNSSLRSNLFGAFLSMGSITLSLMTMFLFSLKERLFDSIKFKNKITSINFLYNKKINRYDSLIEISKAFILLVFLCIFTSILQITIGLFCNIVCISLCISEAISTILLLLYIIYKVYINLEVWFSILKEEDNNI